MLLTAGLLEERDGQLLVTTRPLDSKSDSLTENGPPAKRVGEVLIEEKIERPAPLLPPLPQPVLTPHIAINIQLHLPETENAEIYEKLFRALREQLLSPNVQ